MLVETAFTNFKKMYEVIASSIKWWQFFFFERNINRCLDNAWTTSSFLKEKLQRTDILYASYDIQDIDTWKNKIYLISNFHGFIFLGVLVYYLREGFKVCSKCFWFEIG